MTAADRVTAACDRVARFVTVAAIVLALRSADWLEGWIDRHPIAAEIVGVAAWVVSFWAFLQFWQAIEGVV